MTSSRRSVTTHVVAVLAAIVASISAALVLLSVLGFAGPSTLRAMVSYGISLHSLAQVTNLASIYFLAAVAVALGFRMNMFNIGVNGQYVLGTLAAAIVAGTAHGPVVLVISLALGSAMSVGALWAGIAAWLKIRRGVSEVISTIMLNFVALAIMSFVIMRTRFGTDTGVNMRGTPRIPESYMLRGVAITDPRSRVYGMVLLALVVGVAYWVTMSRTVFGYDIRATGQSPEAARFSGAHPTRLTAMTLLLSGAVAGLVGLPYLFGTTGTFTLNFPVEWGWTGIAVALVGRNSTVGMTLAAFFWAFLDVSSTRLILDGVPREVATVIQGITVVCVVVAYHVVERRAQVAT